MAEKPMCPVKDCTIPVDIVLQSSDKCLIGAHKDNLARYSDAFPTPDSVRHPDTPVNLTEAGEVLSVLLQFMHDHRLPDLSQYGLAMGKPTFLASLGEAAEKYMVHSAMVVCKIRMAEHVQWNPLECLVYGVKFDYPDLADAAAPHTLGKDVEEVIRQLGSARHTAVLAWIRYRERHLVLAEETVQQPSRHRDWKHRCPDPTGHWVRFSKAVLAELPQSPLDLVSHFSKTFLSCPLEFVVDRHMHMLDECPRGICREVAKAWVDRCVSQLKSIPEFHTFLNES